VRVVTAARARRRRCARSSSPPRHGGETWSTVGVSTNIIEASWQALVDAVEYGLLQEKAE
jgi:hypothetical protein